MIKNLLKYIKKGKVRRGMLVCRMSRWELMILSRPDIQVGTICQSHNPDSDSPRGINMVRGFIPYRTPQHIIEDRANVLIFQSLYRGFLKRNFSQDSYP